MSKAKMKKASVAVPDQQAGAGGELHQVAGSTHPQMTNQRGLIVGDDENSLKANPRGPVLIEDHFLVEKTQHFDHERIPERVVHARGFGAKGFFQLTDSLKGITKARVLTQLGVKIPLFTRFSTVAGNMGSADTARDVRGFAVKMYTDEGNWDIVGNNIPVFFIQDAHQVRGSDPCREARAGPWIPASADRS
jgi:catalase